MKFDVFGRIIVLVNRIDHQWQVRQIGIDGKSRALPDLIIPDELNESELLSFLEDMFHEWATDEHPMVEPLKL